MNWYPFALILSVLLVSSDLWAMRPPLEPTYFSESGEFVIDLKGVPWVLRKPRSETSPFERVFVGEYQLETSSRPQLFVRFERLDKPFSRQHLKQWLQQFSSFGFQLEGQKPFKTQAVQGFLFELRQTKHNKRLQQVVFVDQDRVATLTCFDHESVFAKHLLSCQKVFTQFQWIKRSKPLPSE